VTRPGLTGWRNCLWLPFWPTSVHSSFSRALIDRLAVHSCVDPYKAIRIYTHPAQASTTGDYALPTAPRSASLKRREMGKISISDDGAILAYALNVRTTCARGGMSSFRVPNDPAGTNGLRRVLRLFHIEWRCYFGRHAWTIVRLSRLNRVSGVESRAFAACALQSKTSWDGWRQG